MYPRLTVGAYNELAATIVCPSHLGAVEVLVQFKYGSTWQHSYRLGEFLTWGKHDSGERAGRVVVDGEAGPCPTCGFDGDWRVRILVMHGRLVEAHTAEPGAVDLANGYEIIE
jgi:hypothetical protein